ncbi:hypothetical protein [Filimonas effusa]|uniref:Uncharacterized protein n=1 Tax=Filimonas effusa TaxID=2508721 RepID=A0A4V1M9X5_9BACT|nr:hypothetical protein [Filimonas effusa]RXK83194.1 hypothetical protein ESB13_13840 [Filimonas effusa]
MKNDINLEKLQSLVNEAPDAPQPILQEKDYLNREASFKLELARVESAVEYNKTLVQNNKERKKYAFLIFTFTCIWTFFIFIILFCQGFGDNKPFCFNLSDSIMITLITTTTVNFLGFFLLVTKYLFHAKSHYPIDKIQ